MAKVTNDQQVDKIAAEIKKSKMWVAMTVDQQGLTHFHCPQHPDQGLAVIAAVLIAQPAAKERLLNMIDRGSKIKMLRKSSKG